MARLKSNHFVERLKWGEDTIAIAVFAVLTFFPALEILTRLIGRPGIPASAILVQHMTLWIGFIGAVLATRQNKLLSLIRKPLFQEDKIFHLGRWIAKNISFIVILFLFWGSLNLVIVEYNYPTYIAPGILRWVGQSIMPLGFLLIAAQIFLKSTKNHLLRATMLMITIFIIIISLTDAFQDNGLFLWCSVGLILFSMIFGTPIFIGLGGLAILFFWSDYTPISAISAETYRIVVSPSLPTIPLFTLAGYILAESRASERMLQLFRTAFGWLPGGTPVVIVLLCGFFTALTGGSGVTILALGGLFFLYFVRKVIPSYSHWGSLQWPVL